MIILDVKRLRKSYDDEVIIDNLSFTVEEGKMVALVGPSGSGKSTLLNILGLLEKPDGGEVVYFEKENLTPFTGRARSFIAKNLGYLFQNYALVDNESVAYNLSLALQGKSLNATERDDKINKALNKVGLGSFKDKKIYKLSGGEQQRIALARLFLKKGNLILCDEPTGSLDEKNRDLVLGHLKELQEAGKTIIIATHDPVVMSICDEVIRLEKEVM